jgi:integrase/recombinase XerD
MLETFYFTAMRRSELIHLKVDDVDWQRETMFIRQGKGGQDRHVPIGRRALAWLRKYLDEARPAWAAINNETTIYLSCRGRPLGPENLSQVIRDYIHRAEIGKSGSCHLFRHTATRMSL